MLQEEIKKFLKNKDEIKKIKYVKKKRKIFLVVKIKEHLKDRSTIIQPSPAAE